MVGEGGHARRKLNVVRRVVEIAPMRRRVEIERGFKIIPEGSGKCGLVAILGRDDIDDRCAAVPVGGKHCGKRRRLGFDAIERAFGLGECLAGSSRCLTRSRQLGLGLARLRLGGRLLQLCGGHCGQSLGRT